ncbi:hypothetical protein CE91St36_06150 [Christensenellaceae bacterium]|nr:hypothetical protein CE91St36_06150 [Christensenellaceae bacterium]BDF60466.1 hypothetical protein CE91St37_06160 [Christensenellaceae bacterium]
MKSFDLRNHDLFLRNAYTGLSRYEIPLIHRQDIDLDNLQFIGYHNTKTKDAANKGKTVHFFLDDVKFESAWNRPQRSIERLRQYKQVLSPDFSLYTNMPLALQLYNVFRQSWMGAYWQQKGLTVIPTVTWGDTRSYDFCFDGIEPGAVVAVSTLGAKKYKDLYLPGFIEMIKRLMPQKVLCYTNPFPEMADLCDMIEIPHESITAKAQRGSDS